MAEAAIVNTAAIGKTPYGESTPETPGDSWNWNVH
jgi:hypothetical protein